MLHKPVKVNQLTVNDKSTGDFDFPIFVEKNDGFRVPKKKNLLYESDRATGAKKLPVNAWPPIPKTYVLYCPTATLQDLRGIKLWASDDGKLIAADEPDVFYEIIDVDFEHSPLDDIAGYRIVVTFVVQPFGYELGQQTKTYQNGDTITNHTNAPMYPRITVYGEANDTTLLTIGDQTVALKRIQNKLVIENKPLEQNVFTGSGDFANSWMRGGFFEIPANTTVTVSFDEAISKIDVLERWGWR